MESHINNGSLIPLQIGQKLWHFGFHPFPHDLNVLIFYCGIIRFLNWSPPLTFKSNVFFEGFPKASILMFTICSWCPFNRVSCQHFTLTTLSLWLYIYFGIILWEPLSIFYDNRWVGSKLKTRFLFQNKLWQESGCQNRWSKYWNHK